MIEDESKGFYLVGEIDGQIVLMVLITYEWSDWRNGNWFMVSSAYTHPNHRRKKYFTKLLEEVEGMAKNDSFACGLKLDVRSDNTGAKQTYENFGFEYHLREVWVKKL